MKSSRLEKAILTLEMRQMPAGHDSHIGQIDPRALLVVTLLYLVAMLSVPASETGRLIWFAAYPIITAPLAHEPFERVFAKSLYVLPVVVIIGIFNPLYDHRTAFVIGSVHVSAGWVSFLSIVLRGLMSVQALLLLISLVGFNGMCSAMAAIGVPRMLTTQLLMVYRYMGLLLTEALEMHRARVARGLGHRGYRMSAWATYVGQLMIRTIERARRIHMAMTARGFDGTLDTRRRQKWHTPDTVYVLVWTLVFICLRFADIQAILLHIANR